MKGMTAIVVIAVFVSTILLAGCIQLKSDYKSQLLPTQGYGAFKMKIDDPGPVAEVDEGGVATGRRGFLYDIDQSGNPILFYQIQKLSAGIVSLAFDFTTGEAVGGQAAAVVLPVAGTTDYEIPLQSLTQWIKGDQAVGYIKSLYVDTPDVLVWNDRIFGGEDQAPMTGRQQDTTYQIVSLGTLDVSGAAGVKASANQKDAAPKAAQPAPSAPPLRAPNLGGLNGNCNTWIPYCAKLDQCGHFGAQWSSVQCTNTLFAYTKSPEGQTYDTCIGKCSSNSSCGEFLDCRNACWNSAFTDVYGCGGDYGPAPNDVVMLVERAGALFKVSPGYTVQAGEKLAIVIDYKSAAANFAGGTVNVTAGSQTKAFAVPANLGHSSYGDKVMLAITLQSPLPKGDYELTIRLQNAPPCKTQGKPFPAKFSSAGVISGDSTPIEGDVPFSLYEVYASAIDVFNVGQGFVDASIFRSSGQNFFDELANDQAAIMQGEIWTLAGVDDWTFMTSTQMNSDVFSSTHVTHKSKYDSATDVESSAFYCDQPIPPGAFSFYGDAGWNIYPIGPYGQFNTTQPFVHGNFDTTRLHIPFQPFTEVSSQYTGCADTCEYYLDEIYSPSVGGTAPGFPNEAAALAHCHANSADPYWTGLIECYRLAEGGFNACVSLSDCLKTVPPFGNAGKTLCDAATSIPATMVATIPPAFLASPTYGPMLQTPGRVKIGIAGEKTSGGWELVPGSFVDLDLDVTRYDLSLPYMPQVPLRFIQSASASGPTQTQLFPVMYDTVNKEVVGTGYYNPAPEYPTGQWFFLYIYTYNWTDVSQEGWSLGVVSGNSIYNFASPYNETVGVTFGDLRAIQGGQLTP